MPAHPSIIRRTTLALAGPAALVILAICMLHQSLFSGGRFVPAWPATDLFEVYLPWRYFGFNEWMHGHFPFWNPHVFCGIPFFGQIQSSLLYPIAWANFFLNTATAATLEMTINLAIGGICTYAWARQRRMSRSAAALSGAVFAFSGPFYEHVIVGYLTVLATLAWAPLVFLAVDRLLEERFGSGILIGAVAICLQCLAGHAQILYYTLLVAGLYVLLQSIGHSRAWRLYAAFAGMCLLGAMLAAVQLVPSYFASQLSVRAGGTSYDFAGRLSLPPEALLTLFVPYPLGDKANIPYMGRWYLWEMTLYVGIISTALACIGLSSRERSQRWRMVVLLAAILVLALGANTPVFHLLFNYLPGFNLFRGASKFTGMWALFVAILAGHGWEQIQRGQVRRSIIWLIGAAAATCAVLALIVSHFNSPTGPAGQLLKIVFQSNQYYGSDLIDPHAPQILASWLSRQWCLAAAWLAAMCLLIHLRRFSPTPAYLLLALAVLELCSAGAESTPLSPTRLPFPQQWTQPTMDAITHDQRILFSNMAYINFGEIMQFNAIWGYDTGQPKRYTELFIASQNDHADSLETYDYNFRRISRVFQLLRGRYILRWDHDHPFLTVRDPMPHLSLIGNYIRMTDPAAIATRLVKDFDFRQSVILETDPSPRPTSAGAAGRAVLLKKSINDLEIQVDLPAPALLLITDAYAPGWQVRPLESNPPQSHYDVLCADDVLRVIPLAAGHHHFDLAYTPPGLWAGTGLSAIAFAALAALAGRLFIQRRRSTHANREIA